MSTIVEMMLGIKERCYIYYHKDINQFNHWPISKKIEELDFNKKLSTGKDCNDIMLPTYEEIDHKEIMSFYVREYVEDKEVRKQLFYILRRREYMDAFLDKLRELNLYDDFIDACGDVYEQIFWEWADKYGLQF